jgi:APA family basic amino acid/polyamine antiporter
MAAEQQQTSQGTEQLIRAIGPWGLSATAVNGAIGAGIFVLPGLVAAILGPAAILAYLICGTALALVLTCFVEIGSFVQRSGGSVAYIEEAFGPLAGFLGWLVYSGGIILSSAALGTVLVASAAVALWPALAHGLPRVVTLLLLFGALAMVNIRGVRQGLRLAVTLTVAKLTPLLFVIVGGALAMHWQHLRWSGWPSMGNFGRAALLLFFAFQGSEDALTPSGEIRDPARTVPRAIFGATTALILIYASLQVVSQGVLGAALAHQSLEPLAAVAQRVAGPGGGTLLRAGLAISILGLLSGRLLNAPRAFFLIAQNGMLPAALARVHPRFRTPDRAIVTVAALMFLAAVTGEFRRLAVLSSVSFLSLYLGVCLAALRLRYTRPRQPGAFRAPGGPLVGVLGVAIVVWLLAHSTIAEMVETATVLALGAAYYATRLRWRPPLSAAGAMLPKPPRQP